YPVPASEVLQVQRPRADLISYQVLDISGRIVQAGVSEQRTISISVAALSPEVYVLRLLEWERQIAHERFLVAR
ncbi:MAG: T9SS type A sorting domain-containing protein, partial [Flavobacteriales bacterium]|nr:T9SS type A sorting domain-containing protein [Flavobacteriales bacterium]